MSPTTNLETILLLNKLVHNKVLVPYLTQLKNHDLDTYEHSKRVAELSVKLGKMENLNEEEIEALAAGGLLHDIGKLIVDKHIINKPGSLDEHEKEEMKQHTQGGYSALNDYPDERVKEIVVGHHGYQDNPYPRKEKERADSKTSELTQIVALADEYDALSHERPYKAAMDDNKVLDVINDQYTGDKKHIGFLRQLLPAAA